MARVLASRAAADATIVGDAIAGAWFDRFDEPISDAVLALLLALSHLETAGWTKMFNNNLGNVVLPASKRDKPGGPDHFVLKGDEGPGSGSKVREHHYRAYGSLAEGARGLIGELGLKRHWFAGLLSGNPETFVANLGGALGGPRYYEANPSLYLDRYMGRYELFRPSDVATPKADPAEPGPAAQDGCGQSLYSRVRAALTRFGARKRDGGNA